MVASVCERVAELVTLVVWYSVVALVGGSVYCNGLAVEHSNVFTYTRNV